MVRRRPPLVARYRITLTPEERDNSRAFVLAGKEAFRRLKRAQILLAAESGSPDAAIAANVVVGTSTVFRTKRRFVEEGLDAALSELPRPGADRKLAQKDEALLVATACSKPPAGRARWTLDLLAGEMVRLTEHDSISSETIRRRLAENELKPWLKKMWCIPKVDSGFVQHQMKGVLDLYAEKPNEVMPCLSSALMRRRGNSSANRALPVPAEAWSISPAQYVKLVEHG